MVTMDQSNGNSEDGLAFIDEAYPKIKIYDHVMRVLGRYLDDRPRRPEDYFLQVPKVLRLPVYESAAVDIRDVDKTLHDHYVCTYWMTALRKLQMFRGERDDPVDSSKTRKFEESSGGDSGQGDDALETECDHWRRSSAIDSCSSGCQSSVESNHSYNFRSRKRRKVSNAPSCKRITRRRRRHLHRPMVEGDTCVRRSSPKPRLKLCRYYFSTEFRSRRRKSARNRRELKVYRDCRSASGSDPDSGTNLPVVRKVVDRKRRDLRLVSEGTMLNVVYQIPYKLLDFHPNSSGLPYMELSLKGIGGALYKIGKLMTFYRKVARDMCLDVSHPRSPSRVSESLKVDLVIFFSEMNIFFESLFPAAFTFLLSEGTSLRKLKQLGFYKDRFAKQWQGLNLSLNLILFDEDPVAEQTKSELASYYKAICTLKSKQKCLNL